MKRIIRMFILFSVCCSIWGCSDRSKNQTQTMEKDGASAQGGFEIPQTIETELADNILLDAQVTIPEKAKCGTVTCALGKPLDLSGAEEKLRRIFGDRDPDAVFETEEKTVSLMGESLWLGYNDNQEFVINSKEMQYRLNCFPVGANESNGAMYLEKENLPFMSRKDAFTLVKEELGEVGIQIGSMEACYVMDHEEMRRQEDITDTAGVPHPERAKDKWEEQDDTYYFFMHQQYDGIPMIYNPYSGQGFLPGEECTAMVSEEGLLGCSVMGCYTWNEGEKAALLPFGEVLETIRRNYGTNLVMNYEITAVDFYMDILPKSDGTAELRPVWSFSATENDAEGSCTFHIVIDGETGKELTENL